MMFKTLYIPRTMNPATLVNFLGWAALTYHWLNANLLFAAAINQAIQDHNDAIRQQALQELRADPEEEEDSEDES